MAFSLTEKLYYKHIVKQSITGFTISLQVVQIQHTELGHDHVSHLDILDVQENRHQHAHSSHKHSVSSTAGVEERVEDDENR